MTDLNKPNKIHAIMALKPGIEVTVTGDDADATVIWHDGNPTNITEEQIAAKLTELRNEYNGLVYARARAEAYPVTSEFIEAYTEKEIGGDSTKWDAYIVKYNKVRSDNPK